jgi:hypothetical protein
MAVSVAFKVLPLTLQSALGCASFWALLFLSETYDFVNNVINKVKNLIKM